MAELEVAHNDSDLCACNEEDDEHYEEESEHVVELVQPNGRHYKEDFNEARSEGKDTTDEDGQERGEVPRLLRNVPWNQPRLLNRFGWISFEGEVAAKVHQWHGDTEPEHQQSDKCSVRHSPGRFFSPHEHVEDEKNGEADAGEGDGRPECELHPFRQPEKAVEARPSVAGEDTHEDEEEEKCQHKGATVSRGEESKDSKNERGDCHAQELVTRPNHDTEQRREFRRSENLGMHQLPSGFLTLGLFVILNLVVTAKVTVQRAHHDHSKHG
mmetsp:Transcript_12646/g.25793  ORF Transcript_12646/g.25793 Transcript_12646/m.25793 type:complete len:270 (-) Transcript_12646:928-1737(-)